MHAAVHLDAQPSQLPHGSRVQLRSPVHSASGPQAKSQLRKGGRAAVGLHMNNDLDVRRPEYGAARARPRACSGFKSACGRREDLRGCGGEAVQKRTLRLARGRAQHEAYALL